MLAPNFELYLCSTVLVPNFELYLRSTVLVPNFELYLYSYCMGLTWETINHQSFDRMFVYLETAVTSKAKLPYESTVWLAIIDLIDYG